MMKPETIRARLLQRRRELLSRYRAELERVEEELAARDIETVERATEEWDAQVLSSLGDHDLHAIVAVSAAITRLDEGTYGACVHCENDIPFTRLEALPEAATCIGCAGTGVRALSRTG